MVLEKKDNSRSGKSQGISPQVRENLIVGRNSRKSTILRGLVNM